ncbi:valyl-tRNA synthetase [Caldicoprobacter guelmensis]|uniref:valine--tRNA ligase n=1 Tax=Caldicoprobacter guelmensis TaxID=1170224 RepID=UPI00195EC3E4|nr:valine--tRNA ligase [Caldicoprobacter guelmensis]MBM7583222.1 valyl-tRNA synthetase [Caldicoprobacter guelmensis]
MQEKLLDKTYDPSKVEDRLYRMWMEKGYFRAEVDWSKEPFCVVIPPPNITGELHMGHALNNTLQDILVRWRRMQGYVTLWLPGTDHASIATEVKIVEKLAEEGLTKSDLGREEFLKRAWKWKEQYGGRITQQLKKLGSSLDWSRERFTMDEGCSRAVVEVFVRLYKKGLIYRGDRIINWCPDCRTALSDAEVEHEEEQGNLWYVRYPIKDSDESIMVATTRPETMLGDTAVAVHPEDERYRHLIGKTAILPIMNREIPIIADEYVERGFGTGAVKITPAHDPNDFEVASRHDLPWVCVIDEKGVMNHNAGKYQGMDRYEARKAIVEELQRLGLLVKVESHKHNVGHCYRCGTVVEPLISKQWFVKMKPLAEPAIKVVKEGKIRFVPERFEKVYFNWMENIKDWCISRQLWWGHRIPAYYCQDCGETMVERSMPEKCVKCGSTSIIQDEDVLDTWFSSALWPFSTLGWPDETEDLKYFYPTSVLVTGYDIIFFWVARMIFSGLEHMGEIPFRYVLIHGIVRDSEGRKMSKSLGNGIDPLKVIEKYGADALRLTLVTGNSPGNDMRFYWERVEASRNFCNKLWNAARFILMNMENSGIDKPRKGKLELPDRWIISRCNRIIKEVTENLEKFELGIAVQKLYDFIWDEFCDWYIELAKPGLYSQDLELKESKLYTLTYVLANILKLLHPFMPFITEEIWQHLPNRECDSIMVSSWPKVNEEEIDAQTEEQMAVVMDAIRSIRNIRAEMEVPPSRKAKVILVVSDDWRDIFEKSTAYFEKLAWASEVVLKRDREGVPSNAVSAVTDKAQIFMPLEDLVDIEKEMERLLKEKANLEKELARVEGKLSNRNFVEKAPPTVVEEERKKKAKYEDMMTKVLNRIEVLNSMRK